MKIISITYEKDRDEYKVIIHGETYDGDLNIYIPTTITYHTNQLPKEIIDKFGSLLEE